MKFKKADTMAFQVIVVLVVAIAFALLYFFWLRDYRTSGENLSDYQICKSSNFENAKLKLKIDNWAIQERSGNKCKTEYLEVPKEQELNFVARKLAGCWDMYLEGKEALFDSEDNTYCAMCSVLTFEDKKELKGLTSYLMDKVAPGTGGKKYYEYLTSTMVRNEELQLVKDAERDEKLAGIMTDKPWAVIFIEGKDINPGSLTGMSSVQQAAIGAGVGAVAGGLIAIGAGLCAGVVSCVVGLPVLTVGAIGAAIVGAAGYFTGSSSSPDLDSRALLWRYTNEDLAKLKCTILEGQDYLEIRK